MLSSHRLTQAALGLAALLLATIPSVARAQAPDTLRAFPDSPGGRLARAWFPAFSGEEAGMRAFFEAQPPSPSTPTLEERLERWRRIRSMTGALVPVRVLAERPGGIDVLARSEREWLRIGLGFAPEPPHALTGISLDQARGDEQPRSSKAMTEAQLVDSLASHLDRLTRAQQFSGAVRLERQGRVLFERAYGLADAETGRANTVETRFNLGSLDKLFTQAAIARLAEQGELALDDTLSRLLPAFPRDKASRITIRQLLEMRSGLGDFFGERYDASDRSKLRELSDWLPLFADKPLEFEPGTSRRYSNAGYLALGLVIERLTGKPYREAVRELVLEPAGLTHTAQLSAEERGRDAARGYTTRGAGEARIPNEGTLPWRGSSAGGGYSTVGDLARFAQALREGRVVKGAPAREVLRVAPKGDGTFSIQLAAAGGAPGINGALEAEDDWTIAVLTNLDPHAAEDVARQVRDWMEQLSPDR